MDMSARQDPLLILIKEGNNEVEGGCSIHISFSSGRGELLIMNIDLVWLPFQLSVRASFIRKCVCYQSLSGDFMFKVNIAAVCFKD